MKNVLERMNERKHEINVRTNWNWLYAPASMEDVIVSLEETESPEEYDFLILRGAMLQGYVITCEEGPSDVVIRYFRNFSAEELEGYSVQLGDLPSWLVDELEGE